MIALRVLNLAIGLAIGVFVPFISVNLASRGFGPAQIGLVASLGALGFTIAVPVWGHLADVRLGRPRTLQVCAIGAGMAVVLLLRDWSMAVIALLFFLYWVFASSWQPLSDALAVNALRGRRGGYERVRLLASLTFAIGAIGAGFLYDQTGYGASSVLLAVGAVLIAVTAAFVPDVGRADLGAHRARSATPARTWRLGSVGVALRVAPRLGAVLFVVALLHIGIISGYTFLSLRLVELGGSPSVVALSAGISAFAEVPSMLVAGWIAVRIGLRGLFAVGALLYGVAFLSWAVVGSVGLDHREPHPHRVLVRERHRRRRPDHCHAPPGGAPGDRPGALPDDGLRHRLDHRQRGRRAALQHGRPRRRLRARRGPGGGRRDRRLAGHAAPPGRPPGAVRATILSVGQPWIDPTVTGVGRVPMHSVPHPDRLDLDGTWRFQLLRRPDAATTGRWLARHRGPRLLDAGRTRSTCRTTPTSRCRSRGSRPTRSRS